MRKGSRFVSAVGVWVAAPGSQPEWPRWGWTSLPLPPPRARRAAPAPDGPCAVCRVCTTLETPATAHTSDDSQNRGANRSDGLSSGRTLGIARRCLRGRREGAERRSGAPRAPLSPPRGSAGPCTGVGGDCVSGAGVPGSVSPSRTKGTNCPFLE